MSARPLPMYVDPIRFGSETYARNSRGLHVPALTLTVAEQRAAPHWREAVEDLNSDDQDLGAEQIESLTEVA